MFYSQVILARKGPLSKIWLAAHFDKKLTKNQIFSTDISESVESVLNSSNPLALRVSGHLMLGIVRIYGRKVKYLMSDCTEAMYKIKLAFKTGNVNLLESQINILNQIDDQRYFGNINPDADFPELEDAGFFNANDSTTKRKLGRGETMPDYGGRLFDMPSPGQYSFDDYISLPSVNSRDKSGRLPSSRDTTLSKASSIELARGARQVGQDARISYSGVGAAISVNFDDEIPAYEEGYDADYMMGADEGFPPILGDDYPQYQDDAPPDLATLNLDPAELLGGDVSREDEAVVPAKPTKPRAVRKAKKQRVAVDERVELSSRACKDMLDDVSAIVRRRPQDPLAATSKDQHRASLAPTGLCQELQDVFNMATARESLVTLPNPYHDATSSEEGSEVAQPLEQARRGKARGDAASVVSSIHGSPLRSVGPKSVTSGQDPMGGGDDMMMDYIPPYDDMPQHDMQYDPYDYEPPAQPSPLGSTLAAPMDKHHRLSALRVDRASPTSGGSGELVVEEPVADALTTENLTGRTKVVFEILRGELTGKTNGLSFGELSKGSSRRVAATCFLECLQLQTWGLVHVSQAAPFADISIAATEKTFAA